MRTTWYPASPSDTSTEAFTVVVVPSFTSAGAAAMTDLTGADLEGKITNNTLLANIKVSPQKALFTRYNLTLNQETFEVYYCDEFKDLRE